LFHYLTEESRAVTSARDEIAYHPQPCGPQHRSHSSRQLITLGVHDRPIKATRV